jgi:hypothetical protein
MRWISRIAISLMLLTVAGVARASSQDEVKALLAKFVEAQNAHDLKAVGELLQDSPQFLWITRGMPIWGRDAALKRFEALYQGTLVSRPQDRRTPGHRIAGRRRAPLRADHVFDRPRRPDGAANAFPHEPGGGEDSRWMEDIEHPSHSGTFKLRHYPTSQGIDSPDNASVRHPGRRERQRATIRDPGESCRRLLIFCAFGESYAGSRLKLRLRRRLAGMTGGE